MIEAHPSLVLARGGETFARCSPDAALGAWAAARFAPGQHYRLDRSEHTASVGLRRRWPQDWRLGGVSYRCLNAWVDLDNVEVLLYQKLVCGNVLRAKAGVLGAGDDAALGERARIQVGIGSQLWLSVGVFTDAPQELWVYDGYHSLVLASSARAAGLDVSLAASVHLAAGVGGLARPRLRCGCARHAAGFATVHL